MRASGGNEADLFPAPGLLKVAELVNVAFLVGMHAVGFAVLLPIHWHDLADFGEAFAGD